MSLGLSLRDHRSLVGDRVRTRERRGPNSDRPCCPLLPCVAMTIDAARPRGTASDSLMVQITTGNVVQVHAILAAQAERMYTALKDAEWLRNLPAVGQDPVSLDARRAFQPKVNHILDTHWAHYVEVREAADRLLVAARQYGHAEDAIDHALEVQREHFAQL
ncbi:hypothetical protein Ae168Ps1_5646c [Pseudonocardia sp. Ae168_Ps1]|nr:hypothetical protein Ae168Ps1_5646c [Pseudonocardia sp. Ae168_Ps1]OLL91396.1 hypothetical protein Ae356Ps1_1293 [Pseudonocardia sp. Ae356_Ps1]